MCNILPRTHIVWPGVQGVKRTVSQVVYKSIHKCMPVCTHTHTHTPWKEDSSSQKYPGKSKNLNLNLDKMRFEDNPRSIALPVHHN